MADIHRVDFRRTAGKQHVGEAAGRGADIDGGQSFHVEPEMLQRVGELHAAARDPGMFLAAYAELGVVGDFGAGLVELLFAAIDQPGHDERLRFRPRFGEAAFDEQLVEAALHRRIIGRKRCRYMLSGKKQRWTTIHAVENILAGRLSLP